jgi:hypothetical protein
VIGDMISPFKAALGVDYHAFEDRLEAAIHIRFGLPAKTPAEVKRLIKAADHVSAYFEATQLAGFGREEALTFFGRPPKGMVMTLQPLAASDAQARYVARFGQLSRRLTAATKPVKAVDA